MANIALVKVLMTENKINESIVVNEKDTFNNSSNNLTSNDVDTSIIKLTNQMKKNFILAKQDFDAYLKKNLAGKPKTPSFVTILDWLVYNWGYKNYY